MAPRPHRLVLDTNTVLALWLFHDAGLAYLKNWVESAAATLLTRGDALEELGRVLAYRQFGLPESAQLSLLGAYRALTTVVPPPPPSPALLPICRDPDDQKFLEIARDGAADGLLTRDKALLRLARHRLIRDRCKILKPEVWQTLHAAP